jgi:cell division protein FtsL
LTYLFPIGLACLISFIVYTFQRKRLIVERNELMNNETKTNPPARNK